MSHHHLLFSLISLKILYNHYLIYTFYIQHEKIDMSFFKFSNTYNCLILKSDFDFYFNFLVKTSCKCIAKKTYDFEVIWCICILHIYASRNRKMIKSMFFLFFSYKKKRSRYFWICKTCMFCYCTIFPFFLSLVQKVFFKEWKDIMQLECENPIIH